MLPFLLGGLAVAALLLPASAQAHGIVGRADLPIPVWLFSWAAAIVLVVSFVALSTLWMTPQLQERAPPRARATAARRWNGSAAWSAWGCSRWCSTAASPGAQVPRRTSR